jgi:hypothetical protein
LILGLVLTLLFVILLSFAMFHYVPFLQNSMILVFVILIAASSPGITFSFWQYMKSELKEAKPEVPLVSEDKIFHDLKRGEEKIDDPPGELLEPEVIKPATEIVPFLKPGEAIKAVMQTKVIEALQKCKVEVNINADMDLNGEFKDPKINVAFLTPKAKKEPDKPAETSEENGSEEASQDTLEKPRI